MSAIRHLAVSGNSSTLAAGEFESTVHLYDLNSLMRTRTIKTTLDFGGRRLALSPDGSILAVGAYTRFGIAAYSTLDGSELWRRKDLKKVQQLGFSQDGKTLFCCFDNSACERLDPLDGKSGKTLRGVRKCWTSPFGPIHLLQRASDYRIATDESNRAVISKVSFTALSAAFSPSEVCLSEAAGPVRLFDLQTGKQIWRYDAIGVGHFLTLAFEESRNQFVGISWRYWFGGPYLLHRLDKDTGAAKQYAEIPDPCECAFFNAGRRLVTSSGSIIDVDTGRVEAGLDFPAKLSEG